MRASVRLRAPHVIVDTARGPGKMCCGRERGRERSRGLHATALQIATHTTTPSLTIPSVLCLSQDTNNCSLSLSLSLLHFSACVVLLFIRKNICKVYIYVYNSLFPLLFRSITCIFHCSFFLTSSLIHANFCKVLGWKLIN